MVSRVGKYRCDGAHANTFWGHRRTRKTDLGARLVLAAFVRDTGTLGIEPARSDGFVTELTLQDASNWTTGELASEFYVTR